ncbi:MAG: hypothetical protein FJW30_07050 [Acidobacteria bacterium]|nr:hypothetical protein [Acidobacteriota bacterium]
MSNLHQQLAELRRKIAAIEEAPPDPAPPRPPKPPVEQWLKGEVVTTSLGAHFESVRDWKNHQRHGNVYVSDLQDVPRDWLCAISGGELADVDPRRVAFLDTETTGLAGGSGTYAFLIGVGALDDHGFTLKQYFLRDYEDEPSQLTALSGDLERYDVLVTYNGRAYDQPLLETRFRMSRLRPPFARMAHLDLLFGARRLYKLQLDSCRLVHLENEILGVERIDDVPGALIPNLYFDYLRSGHAHQMAGIFEHNSFDILSLACLTGIIPRAFNAPLEVPLRRGAEMVGLARWLRGADRIDEAITLFRRGLNAGLKDELAYRTMWDCALLEKKRGGEQAALTLFTELTGAANPYRAGAFEELAKYFEHVEKNFTMALDCTEQALRLGPSAGLERRKLRLEKKSAVRRLL